MKTHFMLLFGFLILLSGCSDVTSFKTDAFDLQLNDNGHIVGMVDRAGGEDHLGRGMATPLLSLRINGTYLVPVSSTYDESTGSVRLTYPNDRVANVSIRTTASHIRLELVDLTPIDDVELVVWGPYPTDLNEIIGETVGVVQGHGFAIGLQSLNPKTLGGYPWNENDALPQLDIFEAGDYSDLNPAGKRGVLYRVEAAKPDSVGSTLQAYTRARSTDRIVANRGFDAYTAPAFSDGGILGSSIALFGSPSADALSSIGKIEIAENLPHPMIDGVWGKEAKGASAAYVIMNFGEHNIERALAVTRTTGLRYLYHPDAFETWGHFKLKTSDFPNGIAGLKSIVVRAAEDQIYVGVHMLSNFITPNDPYVTPIPDRRLARVGMTTLSADIDATTDSIPIESPTFFNQAQQSFLRASTVGDEIMQCTAVSDDAPWHLIGCARGAFGTAAKAHAGGSEIAKLDDHGYNVFLTNADLTVEMSRNMAHLFNETGLRQISFDGLEGNRSTGMGNYGEILFTQAWYDALNPNIRSHYIADASRTSHFFWHMYSRMNWGEPWYAGFRESQTEYRLKNQAYFRRNLMPGMLGWFSMRPETSIEDIEWMLARSAGFDAGYGFVTGFEAIEENGHSAQILALLGLWENARMNDIFSESQKKAMQDINNEFHLEAIDDAVWDLYPVTSFKFSHNARERQPGEPRSSTFSFSSGPGDEELGFLLSAVGGRLSGIEIEMENHSGFAIPLTIDEGQHLKYSGGDSATLFSNSWQEIQEVAVPSYWMTVSPGDHVIRFYAEMEGSDDAEAKFEVRLTGAPERIVKQE